MRMYETIGTIENYDAFCDAFLQECTTHEYIIAKRFDNMHNTFSKMRYAYSELVSSYTLMQKAGATHASMDDTHDRLAAQYIVSSVYWMYTYTTVKTTVGALQELYATRSKRVAELTVTLQSGDIDSHNLWLMLIDAIGDCVAAIESYNFEKIAITFSELIAIVQQYREPVAVSVSRSQYS